MLFDNKENTVEASKKKENSTRPISNLYYLYTQPLALQVWKISDVFLRIRHFLLFTVLHVESGSMLLLEVLIFIITTASEFQVTCYPNLRPLYNSIDHFIV